MAQYDEDLFSLFLVTLDQLGGADDTAEDEKFYHVRTIRRFFQSNDDTKVAAKIVNYTLEFMGGFLDDVDSATHQKQILRLVKHDMVRQVKETRQKMWATVAS